MAGENIRRVKAPSDGDYGDADFLGGINIAGFIADVDNFISAQLFLV